MKSFCQQPNCTELAVKHGFCGKHQDKNYRAEERRRFDEERYRTDWTRKLYTSRAWERFTVWMKGQGNVVCQKLINGERCRNATRLFHHLIGPRVAPTRVYVPTNVIGLCAGCHPPTEGTPDWKEGIDFVATVFREPRF